MRTTKNESTCHISAASAHRHPKSTEPIDEAGSIHEENPRAPYQPNSNLEKIADETYFEWPESILARQVRSEIAEIALALLFFGILVAFCCMH
jgi:hypothetical protein